MHLFWQVQWDLLLKWFSLGSSFNWWLTLRCNRRTQFTFAALRSRRFSTIHDNRNLASCLPNHHTVVLVHCWTACLRFSLFNFSSLAPVVSPACIFAYLARLERKFQQVNLLYLTKESFNLNNLRNRKFRQILSNELFLEYIAHLI